MELRIGYGYDVHQLAKGEELWLGGILVPCEFGAVGHSDADVLLHVICDALFGSRAMGDIGAHFPDTDQAYKGIDSKVLLRETVDKVCTEGWSVVNVDATVCLERPKLRPHIDEMRRCIADILRIPVDRVGVKATTTERLGFVGTGEGISAHAAVLLGR
ncbi:MAG: 2-C-methyl-D-erythritol 2,4-cyclodiphosphate synthase [Flavobacteriales bacterium]|jgi:2-C-methyl-D-erythritol 2,4-cyclodiphosphate synthase|nr:2-C-methyl-D-erythritol 2,4-cyclodiphosphate synthase [Flavobacteriales bacterium]